jgi:hypothetical protein
MARPPTKTIVRFDALNRRYYGEIFGRRGEVLHKLPAIYSSEVEVYAAAKAWMHSRATRNRGSVSQ